MRVRAALLVLLPAALASCQKDVYLPNDQWSGCYDHSCVAAPQRVPNVPPLASLSARTSHTCGLTRAGEAWCWGDNGAGQLGDGTDEKRSGPVKVVGGLHFSVLTVGSGFTCGVAEGGTAYCWGTSSSGELGQLGPELCRGGREACSRTPLALPGRSYRTIAAGIRHACALDTEGAAYCWGFSLLGETGNAEFGVRVLPPFRVITPEVFTQLGAGDAYTCALTAAGQAYCWGSDNRGELGRLAPTCGGLLGFTNICSPTPGPVATTERFTTLSVGNSHACGLTPANVALCWGDNGQGQLGARNFNQTAHPLVAQPGMAFTAINASGGATCATPAGAPSVCWGMNLMGKLGVGSRLELSVTPLAIEGGRRFTSFAGGQDYVCALDADGAAYCWGGGRMGQLGSGEMLP
jgi:alpha-tubulin suppressor-like RCC1 family protein